MKLQLSSEASKNVTVAFISITSRFSAGTSGEETNKKLYEKRGGAFKFEVKTNLRQKEGAGAIGESEAVKNYEKKEEEKR